MTAPVPAARLAGFYFAYYAALGAFTPYWSLYLHKRGQDAAAISVLMSLWYATRIVAPSSWGWLVARSPKPIRWLHIGCVATLASFVVFLWPLDFVGLFLAMCVFCFAYNAVMPQFEALTLSHLAGQSERYGSIRVWGSIGFIAVVGALGVVLDYVSVERLPLLMLPLFTVMLGTSLLNDYGPALQARAEAGASFWHYLWRKEVVVFLIVALLLQISFGPFYTFFSIYLSEHGYSASDIGMFWMIGVAAEIAVFVLGARLLSRWDARRVVLVATSLAALRWCLTALFPQSTLIIGIAQLTHAITFAGFYAASMQLLVEYFPGRMSGHGQGVFYGFSSGIGGVLGALVAGQAWRLGGGKLAFALAGLVAALAAVVTARWLRPRVRL